MWVISKQLIKKHGRRLTSSLVLPDSQIPGIHLDTKVSCREHIHCMVKKAVFVPLGSSSSLIANTGGAMVHNRI